VKIKISEIWGTGGTTFKNQKPLKSDVFQGFFVFS